MFNYWVACEGKNGASEYNKRLLNIIEVLLHCITCIIKFYSFDLRVSDIIQKYKSFPSIYLHAIKLVMFLVTKPVMSK